MKELLSPDTEAVLFAVQGFHGPEVVAQAFRALVFGATTEPLTPDLLIRIADEIDPPSPTPNAEPTPRRRFTGPPTKRG